MLRLALSLIVLDLSLAPTLVAAAGTARVKDLADVAGVRDNHLFGYGLVVGLSSTGDSESVFFTSQSISGMLGRLGIRVDPKQVRVRNVAAVMVTTRLPAFARPGTKLDVSVSSVGDARSLAGGVLLITPLTGPDGKVYAVAQGPVQVGGFQAAFGGTLIAKNQSNSGAVPGGAMVEKAVSPGLESGPVILQLRRPDFTTANRIAEAVNTALGANVARAVDPAAVEVKAPEPFKRNLVGLITKLESLEVEADQRARVVVSERTGTVVAGERVRLRPVVVAHGGLKITISQTPFVSQPNPFARGRTVTAPKTEIGAQEETRAAKALPQTTSVEELAKALNLLGVTPRDLVIILQAMKVAGALDADLEVL